jgi:hypothetical protein
MEAPAPQPASEVSWAAPSSPTDGSSASAEGQG